MFEARVVRFGVAAGLAALMACGAAGPDLEPLRLTTRPSDDQTRLVRENPDNFDWAAFNSSLRVTASRAEDWEGELLLRAIQVDSGGLVERSTARSVGTTGAELADGLLVTHLLATPNWPPGSSWVPAAEWRPASVWTEDQFVDAGLETVRNRVLDVLPDGGTAVAVWATSAGAAESRETRVRPFALIFTPMP